MMLRTLWCARQIAAVNIRHYYITAGLLYKQLAIDYWRERILLPISKEGKRQKGK
jgi:hypothetical protein